MSEGPKPFLALSERIERLRDAGRRRRASRPPTWRRANFEKAFYGQTAALAYKERYARSLAYALENEPIHLLPEEELVGMLYQTTGDPNEFVRHAEGPSHHFLAGPIEELTAELRRRVAPDMAAGGAPGHVGWRWDVILAQGIDTLLARTRGLLAQAPDERAEEYYRHTILLWEAVLRWNDCHIAAMERCRGASVDERGRLERLIAICRQVPRRPARSFHEAVQSFNLSYLAVMFENPYGGNGPGRLDYFLWPYLERDLAEGRTTLEAAKELVDELFLRMHERLLESDGWVESIVPGGTGPDGASSVNPLSSLMIHSIGMLNQTHPAVYPRVGKGTPEPFLDLCVHYLLHGQNRAQVYNDDACLRAIVASGTPAEDAAMYMAGGCMEISVQGMASDLNFARTLNIAKTLELVLTGGLDLLDGSRRIPPADDLTAYHTFDELYAAFEDEISREYREMAKALDIQSEWFAKYRPCYLLSSLVGDCLARGREQQDGGARYHDYGFSALGVTTAADSLMGIRRAVYEERRVGAAELLAALKANFAGHESLRAYLLGVPKYGSEDTGADALCNQVMQSVCGRATATRNRFGGSLKPMVFNFVWTPGASRELGARADGALAGELIGHGMTPQRRGMTRGITAALNSTLSLDFECVSGGATTMWDVDDQWISFDLMKSLLRVFLAKGGMIFQGNTTSPGELEEALAHPERYPDLIVRVGGFSARFVQLAPDIQQEIVGRHRHRR